MTYIMKKCWSRNNKKLRKVLSERTDLNSCGYRLLVELTFATIFNDDAYNTNDRLDIKNITEIDNGDYQGTLIYTIPFDTYQPTAGEYLMTHVSYGSCSGCDTLQSIQDWSNEKLTENQLNDFMALCKDLVCNAIKPYNHGWRHSDMYDQVEENEEKEDENTHSKVWTAYHRLVNTLHDEKATKDDLGIAMEEAIGYLGEVLDD